MTLRLQPALPALLLLCVLAGCRHKAPPPPPPVATAPPLVSPSSITVITPLPSVPPEAQADVKPAAPEKPAPPPPVQPVKRTRHLRRKQPPVVAADAAPVPPAGAAPAAAPAAPPIMEAAAQTVPPETTPATPKVSAAQEAAPALGELSTGTTIGSQEKSRMLDEIQAQEGRLSKAKEGSTSDAQAVRLQVRTFLSKARQAIAENDLDGAQTLNTKARVLLDELESQ